MRLSPLDLVVLVAYFVLIASIGIAVSRGQNTAAKFFIAGRGIPGWVIAFTLMGTIIGTGTFVVRVYVTTTTGQQGFGEVTIRL